MDGPIITFTSKKMFVYYVFLGLLPVPVMTPAKSFDILKIIARRAKLDSEKARLATTKKADTKAKVEREQQPWIEAKAEQKITLEAEVQGKAKPEVEEEAKVEAEYKEKARFEAEADEHTQLDAEEKALSSVPLNHIWTVFSDSLLCSAAGIFYGKFLLPESIGHLKDLDFEKYIFYDTVIQDLNFCEEFDRTNSTMLWIRCPIVPGSSHFFTLQNCYSETYYTHSDNTFPTLFLLDTHDTKAKLEQEQQSWIEAKAEAEAKAKPVGVEEAKDGYFVGVCGPKGFTAECDRLLKEDFLFKNEQIHLFQG